jgi:predicted lipoprotein
MTRRFLLLITVFIITALGITSIFVYRDADVQTSLRAKTAHAVVADYVNNAILKTLELMVDDIETLHATVQMLQSEPSKANLETAAHAWHAAYDTWLTASAYLYGPAAQYDYHKRIASWPVEKVLVEHTIDLMQSGELELNSRYLREELTAGHRGFHAVKYLLFRNGEPRDVASISAEEFDYLTATTQALIEESVDFEATWRGTDLLSPSKSALLQAAGIPNRASYADEFKNPGTESSRYTSISISLQEIFQDISGILEDITPLVSELRDAEGSGTPAYWDSLTPYSDLLSQLQSVENAYMGGPEGFRKRSISDLVAQYDPVLDRLIKISFAHTAYRIEAVRSLNQADSKSQEAPMPDRELAVRIAEAELEKLVARMSAAIPLVILDPAVRPYAAYVQ